MAGMAVTAAPATGVQANDGVQNPGFTPKQLNDFRIAAVIKRLFEHLSSHSKNNAEFENLCLSLSRGIDFSVANHEVPSGSRELPPLIKQVCQMNADAAMQASIMVLMISVKVACQKGWFPDQDSEELSNLAKKVASNFCSASDFNAEPNPSHPVISTVMSRFFPKLRMGHIFVFLEVKPGFDAYVSDFHIPKSMKCSTGDRIRLFVVQTDNIETSSCLVTPPKVNFLLNGKGVHLRTNIYVETGPQVPTVLTTSVLKYGSNLLQAVGEFNGNYMIIVAFMSEVSNPDSKTLQNCEQHALADADSEVIEGSSRISLNCPISMKRIRTPVKGLSCKHIQCFDFDNYVDINARVPSWRCPLCKQHACFSDIRIDQQIVKVLEEVGPKVSDVMVSSDGSWNDAVMGSEETAEKAEDKTSNTAREESEQPGEILDLTQTDDLMDFVDISENEDIKYPSIANAQTNQSSTSNQHDFWEEIYRSTLVPGSSNVQATGPSASPTSNLTGPFTSTNREAGAFHQSTVSLPNTLQYAQFGNSPVISDYGKLSGVPRHITRTASAVQALPAQTPPASRLQRSSSTNGASPFTPNGLSPGSQASPAAPNLNTSRVSPSYQVPSNTSSPLLQHSTTQVPNMYRVSNDYQNSNQPTNIRSPRIQSMIQSSTQSSTSLLHPQSQAQDRSQMIASANRTAQMSVGASRTVPSYAWNPDANNMSIPNSRATTPPSQPVTRADSADAGWRPTARMRGALTGQAYDEFYNRIIAQPSQQLSRPMPNPTTPLPNNVRPNLPSFMAGVNIPVSNSASAATPGNNLPSASSSQMQ